jgi:hypothetical protein
MLEKVGLYIGTQVGLCEAIRISDRPTIYLSNRVIEGCGKPRDALALTNLQNVITCSG